ncbi:MAG TPA: T9SS type A sorting domain-containing protein [Bacteroidetes bacterium]|nr:T9SS type A sorting domain-containing protein [Bacteroidota bacterium]
MQGRILRLEKNTHGNSLLLDFSGLPDGMYFLKLKGEQGATYQKILKAAH